MVRVDAWWRIAFVEHMHAVSYLASKEHPGHSVRAAFLATIVNIARHAVICWLVPCAGKQPAASLRNRNYKLHESLNRPRL
jgi:hypothetical protein